jgi:hypothetical protein
MDASFDRSAGAERYAPHASRWQKDGGSGGESAPRSRADSLGSVPPAELTFDAALLHDAGFAPAYAPARGA